MLLPIKTICPTNKVRRDGTSLIFIQYCFSPTSRTLLNTEISVPPKYWHKKLHKISDDPPLIFGSAEKLNSELHRMFRIVEDIVSLGKQHKVPDLISCVKRYFRPDLSTSELEEIGTKQETLKPSINLDFFFQIDDYIDTKKGKVSDETIGVFNK